MRILQELYDIVLPPVNFFISVTFCKIANPGCNLSRSEVPTSNFERAEKHKSAPSMF